MTEEKVRCKVLRKVLGRNYITDEEIEVKYSKYKKSDSLHTFIH